MSEAMTPEMRQNRMKEFMTWLPLTIEIAGLPKAPPGATLFSEAQMEARMMSLRTAFRMAKQLVKDVVDNG